MTLPKETIENNSLKYLSSLYDDGYVERRYKMKAGIPNEWKAIRKAHEAGATEWVGRAQDSSNLLSEMRECLEAVLIVNSVRPLQDSELIEDIHNALAKYKEVSTG